MVLSLPTKFLPYSHNILLLSSDQYSGGALASGSKPCDTDEDYQEFRAFRIQFCVTRGNRPNMIVDTQCELG